MHKLLNPKVHGFVDYALVALFLAAPLLFGFTGMPATLCYVVAGIHAAMTLITAFPGGVLKVIPFTVHGYIELAAAVGLMALPWLAGFAAAELARNFFMAAGIAVVAVWLLTDYEAAEAPRPVEGGTSPIGG